MTKKIFLKAKTNFPVHLKPGKTLFSPPSKIFVAKKFSEAGTIIRWSKEEKTETGNFKKPFFILLARGLIQFLQDGLFGRVIINLVFFEQKKFEPESSFRLKMQLFEREKNFSFQSLSFDEIANFFKVLSQKLFFDAKETSSVWIGNKITVDLSWGPSYKTARMVTCFWARIHSNLKLPKGALINLEINHKWHCFVSGLDSSNVPMSFPCSIAGVIQQVR